MKIKRYSVRNLSPIKFFEMDNLSEVVVMAGPNGVGKTTLLNGLLNIFQNPSGGNVSVQVTATNSDEVASWGGKNLLDTSNLGDAQILRRFLQRSTKRGQLKGGVLNFDSARAFEQIQPYNWSWHFVDPFDEDIGWNASFQSMKGRFQDVIHALVRKVRSQKEEIANKALADRRAGNTTLDLKQFEDALLRFKNAFSLLLPGKKMLDINEQTQNIQYEQGGANLDFVKLSSGEREVVTVVFDFLLRNPKDCVVVFDEPELHLHPELSYRLLRTLQEVGERNQFIFCTHSPEIIAAAMEQTVVFVSPATAEGTNQALRVEENDDVSGVLHALGQSIGVISLGKKIVLIEGERNSLDKEAYGSIIASRYPELVLVPTGGKETITGFQKAIETVLNKTIWGVDFFMLCDGDSTARGVSGATTGGRLRFLSRYHLENYFLDELTWLQVFEDLAMPLDYPLRSAQNIRVQLKLLAESFISYAVSLKASRHFRLQVGNVDLMPRGSADAKTFAELWALINSQREAEINRCSTALDVVAIREFCQDEFNRLNTALSTDDDAWRSLIPGRPVLKKFVAIAQQDYGTMKRLYVRAAKKMAHSPFAEIDDIFKSFQMS